MSPRRTPPTEETEIARLLEPLAQGPADLPAADAVYWRARARLAIEETNRRRRDVLRPLRVFHLAAGASAIALAALTALWPLLLPASPDAAALAVPLLAAALATGAWLLAENGSP